MVAAAGLPGGAPKHGHGDAERSLGVDPETRHARHVGRVGVGLKAREQRTGVQLSHQYSTPTRNSPLAGAVGPHFAGKAVRSSMFPLPASISVPTMFRTMCFRKPLPRIR